MIKQEEMPYLTFSVACQNTLIKLCIHWKEDLELLKQLITNVEENVLTLFLKLHIVQQKSNKNVTYGRNTLSKSNIISKAVK